MPTSTERGRAGEAGTVDLQRLLQETRFWSEARDLETMTHRIVASVVAQAGARGGALLLWQDGELTTVAHAPPGRSIDPASGLRRPLEGRRGPVGLIALDPGPEGDNVGDDRTALVELLAAQAGLMIENEQMAIEVGRANHEARIARDELRQEFDLLPIQAWRTDAAGVLEAANRHWYEFTGISPDAVEGDEAQGYRETCHPDDREKVFGLLSRLHVSGLYGEVECRMRRADGVYRRVLARAAPLRDETGAVIRWHGTTTDIEDLKQAEQAQEALARISRVTALGELAVSIAHEVNQPLMSIVTNAASCQRWLASDEPNLSEARKAAARIVRDGHRAGEVIASLRDLSRNAPARFAPLKVDAVINEVLSLARNELERNEISVRTSLDCGHCAALADRVQLQQVVLNLIVNGIEAMEGETVSPRILTISTAQPDLRFVKITISDTGHGLNPGDEDRVFDAFFTSKIGGIGVGLSICRSIVEGHNGRIEVGPNKPRGCSFSVWLPVAGGEPSHD